MYLILVPKYLHRERRVFQEARRQPCPIMRRVLGLAAGVLLGSIVEGATLDWSDGVNLQPSYFNHGAVNLGWELMARHAAIKTVRFEIEPTIELARVQRWLREAHARGYNVIATYHHAGFNGSDNKKELLNAAKWWRKHHEELRAAGPFTINLMNEWGSHRQTPASFAAAYNAAIPLVREVYRGPLIIDLPGWGQETHVAREASRLIADDNIVFSVHIYSSAWVEYGAHHWMTPADLDVLADCGRPVIIGEFGGLRKGEADWSALVDHAKAKGWTLLAWAWNGDGEGMNMVRPYWGDKVDADTFSESPYFPMAYSKLRPPPRSE